MTVPEAPLERRETGLEPVSEGWFVVGVRDAAWVHSAAFGEACVFESDDANFPHVGLTLHVLQPGQPNGMYHREAGQEDFLVLAGECLLLIEGEERRLGPWDFVHCPPDTEHIFVGAGEGPCAILMVGARRDEKGLFYPRSELALRHGAGVADDTPDPRQAYAPFPEWEPGRVGPFPAP